MLGKIDRLAIAFLLACFSVGNSLAKTNLPIPRFASLRAEKVNLRVGPGTEYPIEWVIIRPNLPVQIIAEYETWRQIKDSEGTTGWVHQSMLCGKRHVIIRQDLCKLPSSCERDARPLAKLKAGLVCKLKKCKSGYCQVQTGGYKGWVPIEAIWGVDATDWK
jgi:SH3-like domain-containing protein